jgi:hypothetical protein
VRTAIEAAMPAGTMLTNTTGRQVWMMRYGVVYACPVADLDKPESLRGYARVTDLAKMADAIEAGKLFVYEFKTSIMKTELCRGLFRHRGDALLMKIH